MITGNEKLAQEDCQRKDFEEEYCSCFADDVDERRDDDYREKLEDDR